MTRILFLGEISLGQTSLMRMRALQRLGFEVLGLDTMEPWRRASWLQRQMQRRLERGSVISALNRRVLEEARKFRPTIVWAEKQEYLWRETIEGLRALPAQLMHFTPDPYFSVRWKRTALMDDLISAFDVLIYCKQYEQEAYQATGQRVIYMPQGYCDEIHRPLPSVDPRWSCSVGFLGGWDPRREAFLRAVGQSGVNLKIWGGYWDFVRDGHWSLRRKLLMRQLAGDISFSIKSDPVLAMALQGGEVYGDDYARALTGAKIGLGFLRKVWPDQHTTRTFEIPACGSMLLADRTEDHLNLFEEGREAEFFESTEELVDKIKFYAANETLRLGIATAGRLRAVRSRYAYIYRLADTLSKLDICTPNDLKSHCN